MERLSGKVAIVTGASKGIGAVLAEALARDGAAVVVNYSNDLAAANRVVGTILAMGGRALAVPGRVERESDVENLFAETISKFGQVDVLVNNAGVYKWSDLQGVTEADYRNQFDVNVLGTLLTTQAFCKYSTSTSGVVINIGSGVTRLAPFGFSVYTATKAAVDAITKVLAKELGSRGIRINTVSPGIVETEGAHAAGFMTDAVLGPLVQQTVLGRVGQPKDIAPAVVFLASEEAGWITGETLFVSGGL